MRLSATRGRITSAGAGKLSLFARAMRAMRRLNATLIGLPDDLGLVLGPELSPTASTTTGWTGNNATLLSDGVNLTVTATVANNPQAISSFATVVGKNYRVTASLVSSNMPNAKQIRIGTTLGGNEIIQHDPATPLARTFVATTTTTYFTVGNGETAIGQFSTFTNLSIKEILSARHFIDLSGTLPVTAISDLVGLTLDRVGAAGPELVTNGASITATAGWVASNATLSVVGGRIRVTSVAAGTTALSFNLTGLKTASASWQWSFSVPSKPAGGNLAVWTRGIGVVSSTAGAPGILKGIITGAGNATETLVFFCDATGAGQVLYELEQASVKELTGNHASQPAPASKPLIARVPRKLGPNLVSNGDFSNGTTGWYLYNATYAASSGELTVTAASLSSPQSYPDPINVQPGKSYFVSADVKAGTATGILVVENGGAYPAMGTVSSGSYTRVSGVVVPTGNQIKPIALVSATVIGQTATFDNIEVREVLEWTNALDFDGSNDHLATTILPGTTGWLSIAFISDAVGNFAPVGSITTGAGVAVKLRADGAIWGRTANGSSTSEAAAPAGSYSANVPCIFTMAWTPTQLQAWFNGLLVSSVPNPNLAASTTPFYIGTQGQTVVESFNGRLVTAIGQSTITDEDRRTVERHLAQQIRAPYYDEAPSLVLDFASGAYSVTEGEL